MGRRSALLALCVAVVSVGAGLFTPVLAQRYPPFPIDGSGGTGTGTGGNNNGSQSGSGSEFFNPGGSAGSNGSNGSNRSNGSSGSNTSGTGGTSNGDGGPACDVSTCLRHAGQVGSSFVIGQVEHTGTLRVGALKGCCDPFARIDVYMESARVFLGTVRANEDGSYFGTFELPASIGPGAHEVIVDIEGCGELRSPIQVLAEGASVLGTNVSNTSGGSGVGGSGILPRTGSDFLRVLLWALILIALGTLLIVATRRFAPARARGRSGPVRGQAVAALPPPEVPFVDTSRFVPYRSAPGQRTARSVDGAHARARPVSTTGRVRTNTAWDRARKNESPS